MESFAARAEENGFAVRFVLSKHFSWMTGQFSSKVYYITASNGFLSIIFDTFLFILYRWIGLWHLLRSEKPKAIILVMWHPLNVLFCIMAKLAARSKTAVWLHEPYKQHKRSYGRKAIVFYMVEWLQSLTMSWVDEIVLHSENGLLAFRKRYPMAKQPVHLVPLQLRDQPGEASDRYLISFLGNAAKAKGIDTFFDLVETSVSRGLKWQFGIATCDDITSHLKRLSTRARQHLEIISEDQLSDVAIRNMAARSEAVLCLYVSNMQSGIVPVAYMCGTPVIATDLKGLRRSIAHGETGYLVPPKPEPSNLFEAIEFVDKNFDSLSNNCRQRFLTDYSDCDWRNAYRWLWL